MGNSFESLATGDLSLAANSTFAYELEKDAIANLAGDLTAVTGNTSLSLDPDNRAILTLANSERAGRGTLAKS